MSSVKTYGVIGLHWDHAMVPDNMRETVQSGCEMMVRELPKIGIETELLLSPVPEMTQADVEDLLTKHKKDAYLIGGGIRMFPCCLPLLEMFVNTIHKVHPDAVIVFNPSLEHDELIKTAKRAFPHTQAQ